MEQPSVGFPSFSFYPEQLLFWSILSLVYGFFLVHVGRPIGRRARNSQKALFFFGSFIGYLSTTWPMHTVGEDYLYSVHMVQHVILMLVVPPLLLWGMPGWLLSEVLPDWALKFLRNLSRPVLATLIFNAVMALSHWPLIADLESRSGLVHQSVHAAIVFSAVVMWLPVFSPTSRIPRLSSPGQMLYLFVQSILPTVPASFFTFARGVIVPFYGEVPRLFGIGVIEDQQMAGLVMKIVGGLVIWTYIAVIFFKWYAAEGHEAGIPAPFRDDGGGGIKPPKTPEPGPGRADAFEGSSSCDTLTETLEDATSIASSRGKEKELVSHS